jgi:hypothetical protein
MHALGNSVVMATVSRVGDASYGMGLSNAWSDERRRLAGLERLFDP